MQQHPVPQNVTQYQFRLVGDMTLKQFLELAAGIILAYLFYASNLIFLIKWPFALLSLFFGVALAFFPIEERPLDVWIVNFIRSIYAPTRFVWKKTKRLPSYFLFTPHQIADTPTATKTVKAPAPTSSPPPSGPDLTDAELAKISELDSLLTQLEKSAPTTDQPPTTHPPTTKPSVKVRRLNPASVIFDAGSVPTPAPRPARPQPPSPKEVAVPTPQPTAIDKDSSPPSTIGQDIFVANPSVKSQAISPQTAAQSVSLPAAPQKPNLVVGIAVDREGRLVENAIVEIMTEDGIPARAIKTNSLGQFFTSTPLARGDYVIQVEHDSHSFPSQSLKVADQLIPPLLIRAS